MKNLKGRSFLKLLDFSSDEIEYLIELSKNFKDAKKKGLSHKELEGKNIVLLFEKTSTRTRCAFEVAAMDLGMGVTYLDANSSQMGHKESISDTARVLGRMYDGIEYRGFEHEIVENLSKNAGVPVWNGLTNEWHPTQMLADMLTIKEKFGKLKGLKLVFMGDTRNNVARSLMIVCAKLGINYIGCAPKNLFASDEIINLAKDIAQKNDCTIDFTEDVDFATKEADVIYTDIWVSMGEDKSIWAERINLLKDYKVDKKVMDNTKKDSIFLHCLPSFHNLDTKIAKEINKEFGIKEMEVTDEVFESEKSLVFEQAENRMHTIKAVMYATLSENNKFIEK